MAGHTTLGTAIKEAVDALGNPEDFSDYNSFSLAVWQAIALELINSDSIGGGGGGPGTDTDAIHVNVGNEINSIFPVTPVADDVIVFEDASNAYNKASTTIENLLNAAVDADVDLLTCAYSQDGTQSTVAGNAWVEFNLGGGPADDQGFVTLSTGTGQQQGKITLKAGYAYRVHCFVRADTVNGGSRTMNFRKSDGTDLGSGETVTGNRPPFIETYDNDLIDQRVMKGNATGFQTVKLATDLEFVLEFVSGYGALNEAWVFIEVLHVPQKIALPAAQAATLPTAEIALSANQTALVDGDVVEWDLASGDLVDKGRVSIGAGASLGQITLAGGYQYVLIPGVRPQFGAASPNDDWVQASWKHADSSNIDDVTVTGSQPANMRWLPAQYASATVWGLGDNAPVVIAPTTDTTLVIEVEVNGTDTLISAGSRITILCTSLDVPVVVNPNLPRGHFDGFRLTYDTAARISIGAGACLDSTNTVEIDLPLGVTCDLSVSGANGLDTGTEAVSTWYYVFVIWGAGMATASLLSASKTAPTLPTGYTHFRYLGSIFNDSSGDIVDFRQTGSGRFREYHWAADPYAITWLSGGSATSRTTVSNLRVPPHCRRALTGLAFTSVSATDRATFYTPGSSGQVDRHLIIQPGWAVTNWFPGTQIIHPKDSQLDYNVSSASDSLTGYIISWWDEV